LLAGFEHFPVLIKRVGESRKDFGVRGVLLRGGAGGVEPGFGFAGEQKRGDLLDGGIARWRLGAHAQSIG
jgi:hypothetical protein